MANFLPDKRRLRHGLDYLFCIFIHEHYSSDVAKNHVPTFRGFFPDYEWIMALLRAGLPHYELVQLLRKAASGCQIGS